MVETDNYPSLQEENIEIKIYIIMKKIVLSIILATGFYALVAAQDTCVYYLTPDVAVQKEVVLKSANQMYDLNLMVSVKWLDIDNKIQLIFDRKSAQGNDFFLLLFSMSDKSVTVSAAIDCK
jgi:hypothetical protein